MSRVGSGPGEWCRVSGAGQFTPTFTLKPAGFVKPWTLEALNKSPGVGLECNRNFTNGRNMFGAATCFACHRFNGEGGGGGPDLSTVAGKFSPRASESPSSSPASPSATNSAAQSPAASPT